MRCYDLLLREGAEEVGKLRRQQTALSTNKSSARLSVSRLSLAGCLELSLRLERLSREP